jgi:flavorubredoxin
MENFCAQHTEIVKDMATVKQMVVDMKVSFDEVKERMVSHIIEGEKEGGVRDRVKSLEKKLDDTNEIVSSLKRAEWKRVVVAGVIGGIVSRSPELLEFLLSFIK